MRGRLAGTSKLLATRAQVLSCELNEGHGREPLIIYFPFIYMSKLKILGAQSDHEQPPLSISLCFTFIVPKLSDTSRRRRDSRVYGHMVYDRTWQRYFTLPQL